MEILLSKMAGTPSSSSFFKRVSLKENDLEIYASTSEKENSTDGTIWDKKLEKPMKVISNYE